MHSLETGIIVSIASFFFLSFLTFTFLRETNISNEIITKQKEEKKSYTVMEKRDYNPEFIKNVIKIIEEESIKRDESDNQ
ncbi:MAG: hypothetical protein J6O09_03830 [Lachnospiraceae bacterium]|nr:hypothetical protein [Lachnospiraceae bacterium]